MTNIVTDNRLVRYFQEAYTELRKVVWPTPETTRKHTLLVIGISLFVALYFGVLDYVLNIAVEQII
jgi:preprotein translocase subunit SecE